jgi:hypothetical protein
LWVDVLALKSPPGGEAFHPESVPIKPLEIRIAFLKTISVKMKLAYRLDLENLRFARGAIGVTGNYDDSIALLCESRSDNRFLCFAEDFLARAELLGQKGLNSPGE